MATTKPFSPAELRARIRSIQRHRQEWLGDSVELDRELRIAAEVQQRLFPQTRPSLSTLDYVGYCQPALRSGGDYYDYLELPEPITRTIQLQPRDRVWIFSDGVREAMNEYNVEFSSARASEVLRTAPIASASDLRDALLQELRTHIAGHPQGDDVTFIAGVVR